MENLCRLCAEPNDSDGLLNLDCDETKCNEIRIKLSFLNAMYVNVLTHDNLPKSVCFGCYDSLNKAYDFLDKLKKAQDKLKLLIDYFPTDDGSKLDFSFDDDRTALDEFFGDTHDVSEVKPETSPVKPKFESVESGVDIKIEPKEELSDPTAVIQNSIQNIAQNSSENFSIQDILGSASCKTVTPHIYAKEVKGVNKKTKSWKEFTWLCAFCALEFTDLSVLRSHSKLMHNKCSAFSCVDCKAFTKTESLESFVKHVQKYHRKGLRNRCHYCDENVKSEELKDHLKEHYKNNVPCPMCGEILPNEEALLQHHTEFKTVKQKRKPRRKAGTPITTEDLTCHICKNIYKNPNSLRDHIKRHTTERKRDYTCDRCGKTFYNKGTLTTHVMAHDQVRPHVCRICNKSFVFPNMLRRHVEMHSGIKPFSCEVCGRCFRLQYQLNAHKIIHTDSMPHVCKYCNKAFRFKQILKNHERQHTGAKPYSCEHCCMEFSNWSNYNKHMKRRHNLDTSKKKITPEGVFPFNSATGQIIQLEVQGIEEWKSKVMIPAKRGKKKKEIKEEMVENLVL